MVHTEEVVGRNRWGMGLSLQMDCVPVVEEAIQEKGGGKVEGVSDLLAGMPKVTEL